MCIYPKHFQLGYKYKLLDLITVIVIKLTPAIFFLADHLAYFQSVNQVSNKTFCSPNLSYL